MMPLARGRENAESGVFLTVPWAVAMNKMRLVELADREHGRDASPSAMQEVHDRLAARAPARSGNWYTLSQ